MIKKRRGGGDLGGVLTGMHMGHMSPNQTQPVQTMWSHYPMSILPEKKGMGLGALCRQY